MKSPLHNSRLAGALFFSLNLALALSSCDTTEEGYHVGTVDDVYLTTDPTTQLRIPADGKAQTIEVRSNVPWEIEAPDRTFTVTTSSDRTGNGSITVSAGVNVNEAAQNGTLRVYTRAFNKSVTIELVQPAVVFTMDSPQQGFPEAPEQGGSYDISFTSSIAWRFKALEGDINWLEFYPGVSGEGDPNKINATVTWLPNYTTTKRSVTLQLQPAQESLLEHIPYPSRFTLTQAAGTLPSDISLRLNGELTDHTTIPLILSYNSNSPVDEIGVIVSTTGQRFVAPLQKGNSYPQSGSFDFTFETSEQNFDYTLTPFVRSKVGESTGEPLAITFRRPEDGDNQPIN